MTSIASSHHEKLTLVNNVKVLLPYKHTLPRAAPKTAKKMIGTNINTD